MSIYSDDGTIRYRVATRPNETRTSKSVLLRPGSYEIRVNITVPQPLQRRQRIRFTPNVSYTITGVGISDPTGPEVIDPSDDPFAPCHKNNSDFCYPGNRVSPDPFIVVDPDEITLPPSTPPDPAWQNINSWYWDPNWLG